MRQRDTPQVERVLTSNGFAVKLAPMQTSRCRAWVAVSGCGTLRAGLCWCAASRSARSVKCWSGVVRGDLPYIACVILMGLASLAIAAVVIFMQ
jgi:hypothetical protein